MLRTALRLVVAGVTSAWWTAPARAQTPSVEEHPTKSVAVFAEGPDAEAARAAVIGALPSGIDVVDDHAFRRELARQGQKKPFGRKVEPPIIERVRRAARAAGADTVLLLRVRHANPHEALLLIVDVAGGTAPGDTTIHLELKVSGEDQEGLRNRLAPPPRPSKSGPVSETKPGTVPPPAAPAGPAKPPAPVPGGAVATGPGLPARPSTEERAARPLASPRTALQVLSTTPAEVAVGSDLVGRHFEYQNGISPAPYTYSRMAALGAAVSGEVFPLSARADLLADVGIAVDYEMVFTTASAGTNPMFYSVGLRTRIHPGAVPRVLLGASVAYDFATFTPVGPAKAELPEVHYRAVRPAVDVRVPLGRFSVLGGAGVRAIVDPNHISEAFYGPNGVGFDVHLGGALFLSRNFEPRLVASYARYSFSFTPPLGAMFAVGGAVDQQYDVRLALAYIF